MIHELVHAYLDVTCGDFEPHPVDVTKGDSYGGSHGFVFRSMLNVIFFRVEIYMGGSMNELSASIANTSKITEPKDQQDTARGR